MMSYSDSGRVIARWQADSKASVKHTKAHVNIGKTLNGVKHTKTHINIGKTPYGIGDLYEVY